VLKLRLIDGNATNSTSASLDVAVVARRRARRGGRDVGRGYLELTGYGKPLTL